MDNPLTRIAFVTDDGTSIHAHFGRARLYVVVTLEAGREVRREQREKPGHSAFIGEPHEAHAAGQAHGTDPAAQSRHARMLAALADCQILVARGMGGGAYQSLKSQGIQPILTDIHTIDEALDAYRQDTLVDLPERLH
jgi:predicted Fe-Mo cluster-binding NifX family protein